MSARKTLDRLRSATHIVVRANASGECEFLNDVSGGWTKRSYLALRFGPTEAETLASRVGGLATIHPSLA